MNYEKHYYLLMLRGIARQQDNPLTGYSERHHIEPRSRGGSDDPSNLVVLTAEEHWVAHKLLVKMYPGDGRLVFALNRMRTPGKHTAGRSNRRLYGLLKRELSKTVSEQLKGNKRALGLVHTAESRSKMSKNQKGKNKGAIRTAEHRAAVGEANKRRVYTPEMRAAISAKAKGRTFKNRKPKRDYVDRLISQLLELKAD